MAKRTHFVPCPLGGRRSRFDVPVDRGVDDADFGNREISEAFFTPSKGSPYDFPTNSPDHQAVVLEFDQGALGSFMACMGQPRTNRRIRIFGTDGSLEGDIAESKIVVHKPHSRGNGWEVSVHHVDAEAGNHHGGDAVLAEAFWRRVADQPGEGKAGLQEGIEAVLVALAAQESSTLHQPVDVRAIRHHVFGVASGPAGEERETL
jgi:predicted dehydrogenase